jgi:hypothetical protein
MKENQRILAHCRIGNVVHVQIFGSVIIGIVTNNYSIINTETTNIINLQAETIVTRIAPSVHSLFSNDFLNQLTR